MTWIVAGTGIIYPFMAGDVRVTWGKGSKRQERDCLLKIYPVTRNIVAGFAGSVRIGLTVIGLIRAVTNAEEWYSLPKIANTWLRREIRRVFRAAPAEEQALGCQILMLGTHPEQGRGLPGEPMAHVYKFVGPTFLAQPAVGLDCMSIGSGNDHEHLCAAATKLTQQEFFDQVVMAGPAGPAQVMASELHKVLTTNPIPGVSPYFVYATISNEGIIMEPHARTIYESTGPRYEGPPPLACGPEEFKAFCSQNGLTAAAACAECTCACDTSDQVAHARGSASRKILESRPTGSRDPIHAGLFRGRK